MNYGDHRVRHSIGLDADAKAVTAFIRPVRLRQSRRCGAASTG
jgi:hypothetical protein